MNKAFKGGNALWIIISGISLLCTLGLLFYTVQERSKRIQSEEKLAETEKAKRATEIKLEHAQLESIQLREQAEILIKEVEEKRTSYLAALAEAEKKDRQVNELEINLANEKKQRTSLANKLAQIKENYDRLKERLREEQRAGGGTGVSLRRIVVKPKNKLSGKVLVVNTEFHFVVIDLGRKDDVSVGDEFLVYQGSQEVATIQVEKVYGSMATAAILAGSQEQEIFEDCVVKSF